MRSLPASAIKTPPSSVSATSEGNDSCASVAGPSSPPKPPYHPALAAVAALHPLNQQIVIASRAAGNFMATTVIVGASDVNQRDYPRPTRQARAGADAVR